MKIFFDENYSHYIAEAFNSLEFTNGEIKAFSTIKSLYSGAKDEEVVVHVAENNGILFTMDRDFVKAKIIIDLMKFYKIGLFYYKKQKQESYWDMLTSLLRAYPECRDKILIKHIPFAYQIMKGGKLQEMQL